MELAAGYDSLPYPSKFFLQTHPDRLATLGKLFGMNPQTPEKCRILEFCILRFLGMPETSKYRWIPLVLQGLGTMGAKRAHFS